MPDRYDRATCVTELRLRNEIVDQIADGWRPQIAFEVPQKPGAKRGRGQLKTEPKATQESESDSTSVTSTASHLKPEIKISDLYD